MTTMHGYTSETIKKNSECICSQSKIKINIIIITGQNQTESKFESLLVVFFDSPAKKNCLCKSQESNYLKLSGLISFTVS